MTYKTQNLYTCRRSVYFTTWTVMAKNSYYLHFINKSSFPETNNCLFVFQNIFPGAGSYIDHEKCRKYFFKMFQM